MKFLPKKASKSGVLVQKSGMYLVYSNFVVVVVVCGNVILLLRQQIHKKGMKSSITRFGGLFWIFSKENR